MIDLHCHILPGVDDGPADLEESLRLARALAEDGTRTVAATPHLRDDHPGVVVEEIEDRCRALRSELEANAVDLEVVSGGEVDLLWAARASRDELVRASYGGRGHDLLLETPYGPLPPGFPDLLQELADDGFRLLLAHPERNTALRRDLDALRALAERGVLVQLTAASLAADAQRSESARAARALVAEGIAHVIASDLHGAATARRAPLSAGVAAARAVAPNRAPWMVAEAPAAVLDGRPLPPVPAGDPRGLRRYWPRRART